MQIDQRIYEDILAVVKDEPPETGGILGEKDGWIAYVEYDEGLNSDKKCSYTPNTKELNKVIQLWKKHGITFCGIFHCHYFGVDTLSNGDKEYIITIMNSMPESIAKLYFPLVVLPQRRIIAYLAVKEKGQVNIYQEKIIFQGD